MSITVVGMGCVGLVTSLSLAHMKNNIKCFDVDESKIDKLNNGEILIEEKDLKKMLNKNYKRLKFTTNSELAFKDSNVIFICVNTPEKADGSANLEFLFEAVNQISKYVNQECVVVIKSTVPVGTCKIVEEMLKANSKYLIHVASNPEFLSQGTALHDTLHASRIVVGIDDEYTEKILKSLYLKMTKKPYNVPYLSMSKESAEMVKYATNNFLALKISYINEIANFCEKVDANIDDVSSAMGMDGRIGSKFLKAGLGYGGSCFPKDTKALHYISKINDEEITTIKSAIKVNQSQKTKLFYTIIKDFKTLDNLKIAVLGCSFKPHTDDLRESPSIYNIELLKKYNCEIHVYDPSLAALDKMKKTFGDRIMCFNNIENCINKVDIAVIITEHDEIINFPLKKYEKLMNNANIYDGRNCYKLEDVTKYKINYISIGRKRINNIFK
jgi:UDPglucose 6-dehydrogenase